MQVFVVDKKLFTLGYIDQTSISLQSCEGDKPSTLSGVSLTTVDFSLYQTGTVTDNVGIYVYIFYVYLCVQCKLLFLFSHAAMQMWTLGLFCLL